MECPVNKLMHSYILSSLQCLSGPSQEKPHGNMNAYFSYLAAFFLLLNLPLRFCEDPWYRVVRYILM